MAQAVRTRRPTATHSSRSYSKLSLETFAAIVDEARTLHMRVVATSAREKGITEKFFIPGFDLVAHAEEFAQHTAPPDQAAILATLRWRKATAPGSSRRSHWTNGSSRSSRTGDLAAREDLRYLPPLQYRLS